MKDSPYNGEGGVHTINLNKGKISWICLNKQKDLNRGPFAITFIFSSLKITCYAKVFTFSLHEIPRVLSSFKTGS